MSRNITKIIKSISIPKETEIKVQEIADSKDNIEMIKKLNKDLVNLVAVVDMALKYTTDCIQMSNKEVLYYPCVVGLLPNLKYFKPSCQQRKDKWNFNDNWSSNFGGFQGDVPTIWEVKKFFVDKGYFRNNNSYGELFAKSITSNVYTERIAYGLICLSETLYQAYSTHDKEFYNLGEKKGVFSAGKHAVIPIYRLNGKNSVTIGAAETIFLWLKNELVPDEAWFTKNALVKETYEFLLKLYKEDNNSLCLNKFQNTISIKSEEAKKAVSNVSKANKDKNITGKSDILSNDELLMLESRFTCCDNLRAALDKYDSKMLMDINRGHWDLWDYEEQLVDVEIVGKKTIPGGLVARDPHSDIREGTVAIDFGTKSTVVVYGEGALRNHPLQIGCGNFNEDSWKNKYENPTVVRFKDIETFIGNYEARKGRPETRWENVCVSHTAYEDMQNTNEENYNSFICNLKQWCSTPELRIRLLDSKGYTIELPKFLDIKQGEFNPLEVYAYYIGIYLNNMLGMPKIFKKYLMSFPVSFEHVVRQNILDSFKAGLIKSLPTALINDEKFMANFSVLEGVSEPAAYAATALTEFGYEPEAKEEVYYGVFDFGGGTTDFDFGVLREGVGRCDYDLIHFGANGDKTLGGENILRKLAFEVFKFNRLRLRFYDETTKENIKIPFNWDRDFSSFVDANDFIEDSQIANQNMHNLMEKLRPVWEAPESEEAKKILESEEGIKLTLLDAKGNQQTGFKLLLNENDNGNKLDLLSIIKERIEFGVEKFFFSMKEAFTIGVQGNQYDLKKIEEIEEIIIFLAGNSSKATVVKDIFNEYVSSAQEIYFADKNKIPRFIIKDPLGKECDSCEKPNGKTGVAFGLLLCRRGGEYIRVIDINPNFDKVSFQYYVGRNKKRKFKTYISPNTILNNWVEFIDAGGDFEIYYTDDPLALSGKAGIDIAKNMFCISVNETDEDAKVYIRPIDSRRIEWCIAKNADDLAEAVNDQQVIELK